MFSSPSYFSNWKDKLTGFNGTSLTYDAIGNMLKHYTGFTFEWQNGRQLAGVTGNNQIISYTYNADGIRTSKTVNGVTTQYTLEGDRIVMETNGTDTLWFYYDASGSLTGFELNGTAYFYVKNLQGDIIAIINSSGTKVVEYVYDSWGKLISTTGSLASTVGVKNPYRYRGYRYDTETGLYYLQSRYYDPQICRFINADVVFDCDAGLQGFNILIYCGNNPVCRIDISGADSEKNTDVDLTDDEIHEHGGGSGSGSSSGGAVLYASPSSSDSRDRAYKSMQYAVIRGRMGEAISGINKNTTHVDSPTGKVAYRIPDEWSELDGVIGEVKYYTRTLSYTAQLRDYVLLAQDLGYQMRLYTNARLSGPLQKLVDDGVIELYELKEQ